MLTFDAAPDELQLFLQEAEEQLQLLDQDIVILEKDGPRPDLLQEIFRAAHTLKGSSAAIGHKKMASLTHSMENVLDQLRQGRADCSTELIDLLLESLDGLRLLKEEVVTLEEGEFDPAELVSSLHSILHSAMPTPVVEETRTDPSPDGLVDAEGTLRVRVRIAEDCPLGAARMLQAYLEASSFGQVVSSNPSVEAIEKMEVGFSLEMVVRVSEDPDGLIKAIETLPDVVEVGLAGKGASDGTAAPIQESALESFQAETQGITPVAVGPAPVTNRASGGKPSGSGLGKTVRIDVSRLDDLLNLVGELVIDRTRLTQLGGQLQTRYDDECVGDLADTTQHIGRIVDELQESIMKARMLPVESLFNRLPRVVRDLAQRIGKKVDFVVEGKETELDRSVIEELHDPLVHLLRNCVDHGVEPAEKRLAAGKPEVGTVRLSAMHRENRILIRVEDDGAGIDANRVKATAIKRGILTQEAAERLTDLEAIELIFAPGFSTAEKVSDVSGRGVGMDIVRTNIEKLNGSVSVETWVGKGTRFTLELPLTLAIIDALMVGLGNETLAIPLVSVVETLRVMRSEIQWINKRQAIQLRQKVLPLIELDQALGLPSQRDGSDRVFVVAVRVGENRYGLVVDSLLGELQVVIKSLGRQVGSIPGVTGATILGDGRVALILDVPSLVKCVLDEQTKGVGGMIAPSLMRPDGPPKSLEQIARLGSSEAALDLSKVVGRRIRIEAQRTAILHMGQLPSLHDLRDEPAVAVYLRSDGGLRGAVILLFSVAGGRALVDMMRNLAPGSTGSLGTVERSALGEVGKLTCSFLCRSLGKAVGQQARLSPPAVMVGKGSSVLELPLSGPADLAEEVLAIDVVYADDRRQVKAGIALAPEAPPLSALLEVLERQWQSR